MEKKKIIIVSILIILLLLIVGTGYAFFYYERNGNTTSLALGDIYFHYRETDRVINIENAMPRKLIADDFISEREAFNPIMKSQTLMTVEDLQGNELTKCVNYMKMKYIGVILGDLLADYQQFCKGGTIGADEESLLTLEDTIAAGLFTEDDIEDMISLNIITSSEDTYIRNTIMDTQELDESKSVNMLTYCTNLINLFSTLGMEYQEGETGEAFCKGKGTFMGLTFEEHKNELSDIYGALFSAQNIYEEIGNLTYNVGNLQDLDLPYFEFSVKGKNTYQDKNVEYEVVLNNSEYNGEDKATRNERIEDKFLKFALVEVVGEDKQIIFLNRSYEDLAKTTIFTDSISSLDGEIDKTYRLYMWIGDEVVIGGGDATYDYDMETWSNKIYASIRVDINADFVPKNVVEVDYEPAVDSASFKRIATNKGATVVDTDGTVYLSGTNDVVNYNYVWYSGKLWRITAINQDGSLKLITEDVITSINWGENTTYSESYVRQWLNQEFLPTLYNYQNIIVQNAKWNVTATLSEEEKLAETTMITDAVGLLNSYEYHKSYANQIKLEIVYNEGYLNIGYDWWLTTPYTLGDLIWNVDNLGSVFFTNPSYANGLRPSINLKSNIKFSGGIGTESDPYKILGDKEEAIANTTILNTRSSGEYVKLENDSQNRIFRIVDKELINGNLTTKLVLNDYVKESGNVVEKVFSNSEALVLWSNVSKTDTTYVRGYLNTTWLSTLDSTKLEKGTYYLGTTKKNYKLGVCSSVSSDVSIK